MIKKEAEDVKTEAIGNLTDFANWINEINTSTYKIKKVELPSLDVQLFVICLNSAHADRKSLVFNQLFS